MRKTALRLLAVLLAVLLFLTAAGAEGLRADRDNFFADPDPKYAKLVDRLEKASHNNSFTGSILVATEDGIILYGGPRAMNTAGEPADHHTTYDIGSCSKLFKESVVSSVVFAPLLPPHAVKAIAANATAKYINFFIALFFLIYSYRKLFGFFLLFAFSLRPHDCDLRMNRPGQSLNSRRAVMMLISNSTAILNHKVLTCHEPTIFSLL